MSALLIQNARLLDAANHSDFVGDCLIKDGKIAALARTSPRRKMPRWWMLADTPSLLGWWICGCSRVIPGRRIGKPRTALPLPLPKAASLASSVCLIPIRCWMTPNC